MKNEKNMEDKVKTIIELNKQGVKLVDIAKKIGVSFPTLKKIISGNNIQLIDNRETTFSDELFNSISDRNSNGEGLDKIANEIGIGVKTIKGEFLRRNVQYKTYTTSLYYSKEFIDQLQKDYEDGKSLRVLCGLYDLNKKTLAKNFDYYGINRRDKKRTFTPEQIDYIITSYNNGVSGKALCREFDIHYEAIAKILKQNNVTIEDKTVIKFTKEQDEELTKQYLELRLNVKDIANNFNVSPGFLKKKLTQLGLERKANNIYKTFSEGEEKHICDLYNEGNSISYISDLYKTSSETLSKIIKSHDIQVIDKKIRVFTENEIIDIKYKYTELGYDCSSIGKIYGVNSPIISNLLRKNNVEIIQQSSIPERILYRFILAYIDKDAISNERTFINSGELDIISHKHKICIEYNGLLWHSDKFYKGQNINYHLDKTNDAESKGYKLIQIFEDEFNGREHFILNKLLIEFGINKYIDNTFDIYSLLNFKSIEEILSNVSSLYQLKDKVTVEGIKIEKTNNITVDFINKLSLEFKPMYNLVYKITNNNNNNFIGYITFNDNELKEILLNPKYKINYLAIQLKSFFDNKNNITLKLNRRWFNQDNLFKLLGFELLDITPPEHTMIYSKSRIDFNDIKIDNLKSKYPDRLNENDDVFTFLKKCHYYKIYDCGNLIYIKK
jgi:transposase-like protein